jgi:intein/homing endonuclease
MNSTQVLSELQFLDKYSRYDYDLGRREKWEETVKRVVDFLVSYVPDSERDSVYKLLFDAILNKKVSPSMRLMATAGKAAKLNESSIFNCGYLPLETTQDFHDLTLLLGLGVGVGFSVENHFVKSLGDVRYQNKDRTIKFVVPDDIYGWAQSIKFLIEHKMAGNRVNFDYSLIRPAGAPLKTRGGRASGPEPLMDAHIAIGKVLDARQGKEIRSVDAFDIACHVAGAIVSGGVRRCLPSGSRVHTEHGMKKIEDVVLGDRVLTTDGYCSVTNKFNQGMQALVRVVTQDSSFMCTQNHKIAVLTDQENYIWKRADELVFGDKLIAPYYLIEGKHQELPNFTLERPTNSTNIVIPELDEDMAWLLGLIHGDGHIDFANGEVSISVNGEELELGVRAAAQLRRFGVNVGLSEYENYFVLRVKSRQLANYFHSWLKQANVEIRIPEFIWNAPYEIKMAYVSGVMDADGSVKTRPVNVVTTVYESFARDIQLLLSSCGIQSRIKSLSTKGLKENWQPKFGVYLINNKGKFEFLETPTLFKREIEIASVEKRTNVFPDGVVWSDTDSPLIPVTFIKIENVEGEYQTWDLEVEDMHEFFCNGYLMHNSAMITIFDRDDDLMLGAKSGTWYENNLQRQYANISAVIDGELSKEEMYSLIQRMHDSGFGEPGIFSRYAVRQTMPERRKAVFGIGTNPCGEVVLRPRQFCNLSQAIVKPDDDFSTLKNKVEIATIIGTIQSSMNYFPQLHKDFARNNEEERLLGVSLSGIMDNPILQDAKVLQQLNAHVVETNKKWAKVLGINQSVAATCVKPDGNTSLLYDTSPGLHPRWSPYYIRRVRLQYNNPVAQWLMDSGAPCEPVIGETWDNVRTVVFDFPIKSPESSMYQTTASAIQQLEMWKLLKLNWTEHNPSVTIHYRPEELDTIKNFCYSNQDLLSGVSFLENGHKYKQAPYEEVDESTFNETLDKFPEVDYNDFWGYETAFDSTSGTQTIACVGGSCLI